MKKKMLIKKATTWTMVAAMTMSAAMTTACSGDGEEEKKGDDSSKRKSVSDVTFPLEEKLELDVFVYGTGGGGGFYSNNYVTDWIEEETNVKLNFIYDLDGDDAKTKLNLIMTDPESIPDIFLATHWTKSELMSYGSQGLLLPLDDYLAEAPNWNALNEKCPTRKADITMSDGHIYTYGDSNECFHCMYQNRMWIYKPWVDELNGGKMPETTEELYEFMKKVKTEDPNGNGKADEIPMTGFVGGWATDPTVWLTNAFIQCNKPLSNTNPTPGAGLVVSEDGKIEYQVMKEEYRDALAYMNKLYSEGLLDSQTFTQDETQFTASLDSEENIVALYAGGGVNVDGKNFWANKPGKWQDWTILEPVEGPDGVRLAAKSLTDYFGSCLGVVSASCKNPEIAVALFDFLASEEGTLVQSFGPQGLAWDYVDEGTALDGGTAKYANYKIDEDYDWVGNGYKKAYGDHSYWLSDAMIGSRTVDYRNGQLIENPELNTEYTFQAAAQKYEPYSPKDESIVPNLVFDGQDAQTISESTITIGGYVDQSMVQFITGELNIEKDWDAYIEQLKTMGVDNFLEIYQKYYDEYMEAQK